MDLLEDDEEDSQEEDSQQPTLLFFPFGGSTPQPPPQPKPLNVVVPPPQQQHHQQHAFSSQPTQRAAGPQQQQQQQQQTRPSFPLLQQQQQPRATASIALPLPNLGSQSRGGGAVPAPIPLTQQQQLLQQQQQSQLKPQVDILAALVKAQTKLATLDDIALRQHVTTCTNDKPCSFLSCDVGKEKLEHYKNCRDPKCFVCVLARLIFAKEHNKTTSNLDSRLMRIRSELQDTLKRVRKAVDDFKDAKTRMDPTAITETESKLNITKLTYNEAKSNYEKLCAEVYAEWEKANGAAAAASMTSISGSTAQRAAAAASGPTAVAKPMTMPQQQQQQQKSAPSPAANAGKLPVSTFQQQPLKATTSPAQQPQPHLQAVQPPKKADEIDGHLIEYILGDSALAMTGKLDRENETLTLTSVGKDDDWCSQRGTTDDRERDWAVHNLLTKPEIEAEQQLRLATKRLFSVREHEFLSRAAEELVIGLVADCLDLSKHRCQSSGEIKVVVNRRDVQSILQRQPHLASLVNLSDMDRGMMEDHS